MKTFLSFAVMIGFTVVANLLLKSGAVQSQQQARGWDQFLNWRLAAGITCFGMAALIYVWLLRTIPLNVAQSFASAQFIAVILASWLVLSEPIGTAQWMGILLIACGIVVVGWSRG